MNHQCLVKVTNLTHQVEDEIRQLNHDTVKADLSAALILLGNG